jgi:hypothetical protein
MLAAARQFRISPVATAAVLNMSRVARVTARKGRRKLPPALQHLWIEALPRSAVVS